MGIGMIGGYGSILDYYGKESLFSGLDKINSQEELKNSQKSTEDHSLSGESALQQVSPFTKAFPEAVLEDVSLTFQNQKDYAYLRNESNILNLDMQKAISDMKKDQVLQQYQYFVGSSQNIFGDLEEGIVIPQF